MDAQNLDAEYEAAVLEIKHNLTFLENELGGCTGEDIMVLSSWIAKLEEPAPTVKDKTKRNEYINYLAYMLKREMIHQPFVDVPPEGELPPLNISMPDTTCHISPMASSTPMTMETPRRQQRASQRAQAPKDQMSLSWDQAPEDQMCLSWDQAPEDQMSLEWDHAPEEQKRTKPQEELNLTCLPCKKPGKVKVPARSCHIRKDPKVTPPCYLDFSTEKDTKPFIPPMPGSEESEGRLKRILDSVDGCTRLADFVRHVAPETCDQGGTMNYVASGEIASFKQFVQTLYRSRMQDTEEMMGKEQLKLKDRYEEWTQTVLKRAYEGLTSLKQMLPEFQYDLYKKEPDYLYNMIRTQFTVDEKDLHPQTRLLRIKAQKKRWLTDEAERIEKENEDKMVELKDLNDQLNSLSKCYNTTHKDYRRKNSGLEEKVAALRIKTHQNQKIIDALIDQLNEVPNEY